MIPLGAEIRNGLSYIFLPASHFQMSRFFPDRGLSQSCQNCLSFSSSFSQNGMLLGSYDIS